LREVLAARSDHDFVVAAPRARSRRGAPAKPPEGVARRVLSFALRHPREIAVTLLLAGAGGAIAWNALALQTARHPAPLFGSRLDEGASGQAPAPLRADPLSRIMDPAPATLFPSDGSAPLPPRPAGRDPVGETIRAGEPAARSAPMPVVLPPARPVPSSAPATVATPRPPAAMRDPIGDLIRLGQPAPIPPGLVGRPPGNIVSAGQRALARLGYGVTVDGLMGPSTRQAIEQFERDRRLPVTGEFNPQTARALAAHSGVPVE
jgi:hypothetical protein